MPLFGRSSGSLFSRIASGAGNLFGAVQRGASSLSNLANRAGGILGTVSDVAKNPIVGTLAGAVGLGNVAQRVANAADRGQGIAQRVGGISQKVADVASPSTYFGQNPVPAARNALERVKDISQDVRAFVGGNPSTYTPMGMR